MGNMKKYGTARQAKDDYYAGQKKYSLHAR